MSTPKLLRIMSFGVGHHTTSTEILGPVDLNIFDAFSSVIEVLTRLVFNFVPVLFVRPSHISSFLKFPYFNVTSLNELFLSPSGGKCLKSVFLLF